MKNNQNLILFCLLSALVLWPVAGQAQLSYTTNNGAITITGVTGNPTSVIIPATTNGYPVVAIGNYAFDNPLTNLTSVIISSGVTNIGQSSFHNTFSLTNITVDAVNSIYSSSSGVLLNKSQTTLIYFPQGKAGGYTPPNSVTNITNHAFDYCQKLTSVTFPDSVTTIGDSAFYFCTGLKSLNIGKSITNIGSSVFTCCTGLTNITVDALNPMYCSVAGVLWNKNQTTLIQYPAGNTANNYVIPNTATNIASDAFVRSSSLTNITIGNSVVTIGSGAFELCNGLTSVTFPNSVTAIGDQAFYLCYGLSQVYFLGNAPVSGSSVFTPGYSATYICYLPGTAGWGTTYGGLQTRLWLPAGQYNFLISTNKRSIIINGVIGDFTSIVIPSSIVIPGSTNSYPVVDIGFGGNSYLTSVSIPNSVTNIGYNAFDGCTNLTSVNIPNSVITIGYSAFLNCTGLTNLILGTNVATIGGDAFANCTSLTGVVIPNSVTFIDYEAFQNDTGLTSINIPNNVTNIGVGAFTACAGLTNITVDAANAFYCSIAGVVLDKTKTTLKIFPSGKAGSYSIPTSVTAIGSIAFEVCARLTSVTIPSSVTNIGNGPFDFCQSLTNITVDSANTAYCSISGVLFDKNQTQLIAFPAGKTGSYTIPTGVTAVANYAFDGNTNLFSVIIPNTVTNIGYNAFSSCTGLNSITLPKSLTTIGWDAFGYCPGLTNVYFRGNAPSIAGFTFVTNATLYYLPGTTGWGATYGGVPTKMWNPQAQASGPNFGVRTNKFGFNLTGSSNLVIVVEASTNLTNWLPLSTNTLNTFVGTNGTAYFNDQQWTNFPKRFYRIRSP